MIIAHDFIQDDNITQDELLQHIEIKNTNIDDIIDITLIISSSFNVNDDINVFHQLIDSKIDFKNSVKLIDKRNNKIYGLLLFANNDDILNITENEIYKKYLYNFKLINGFAFIIDKRLRGKNIDKEMLNYCKYFLQNYDYIWCGVDNNLKSHHYWKKLGFIKIHANQNVSFYLKNMKNKTNNDIFILKLLTILRYENNY